MSEPPGVHWANLPDLLTVEEVAGACRIGRNTAYELARQPGFPVIRLGRRLLIPKASLRRWLEERAEGGLLPELRAPGAEDRDMPPARKKQG